MANKEKVPARDKEREAIVLKAILEGYLQAGAPVSADEIAPLAGLSVGVVRSVIRSAGGAVPGSWYHDDARPRYSRDYPGFEVGTKRVSTWAPSSETLRREILALRSGPSK